MSTLRDRVRELWNEALSDRKLDAIVDIFTEEIESLRAELEVVRSRRLAQCPVCKNAGIRQDTDGLWIPCEDCNSAGVIIVDKETT